MSKIDIFAIFLAAAIVAITAPLLFDYSFKINARIKALESASTVAQQPQGCKSPINVEDSLWVLYSSDTSVICSKGDCTKFVRNLYKR